MDTTTVSKYPPTRREAILALGALAVATGAALAGLDLQAAGDGRDLIKWRALEAGEAESRRTGKPVLYFLTAEWCGPCHMMRAEVFKDPAMAQLIHREFIPVEVVDRQREEGQNPQAVNDVFLRFRLRGFPTLAVARPLTGPIILAQGWSRKESVVEFLSGARAQLLEREQQRAAEKPKGT